MAMYDKIKDYKQCNSDYIRLWQQMNCADELGSKM